MLTHNGRGDSYIAVVIVEEPEVRVCDSSNGPCQAPDQDSTSALMTAAPRTPAPIHLRVQVFMRTDKA